ncbi:MAG: AAA family ATPase [Rickettsiales bacterium]|jgi:ATP-dependent exoDNAse (exonuclease V) alpha subunit|nr:AAA family ATPase [Rickettsiales bacterium]
MSLISPILSDTQLDAFSRIENDNANILILGQAGTGKSTFVNYLKSASKKKIITACPTAVSALNIGGQTIHSLFQIQPRDFIMPELLKLKSKPRNVLSGADILIIDEISMVAPDLLDAMDILARAARKNNAPFGGLQVVAIGDLHQLPPVITREAEQYHQQFYGHPNAYFFDSVVWGRGNFDKLNFDVVYRQSDAELLEKLTALRGGDESALEFFNRLQITDADRLANAVIITPFRAIAENINNSRLGKINAPEVLYRGMLNGNFSEKDTPSPLELILKVGALVMFTRTVRESGAECFNGALGIVQELGQREITVKLLGGKQAVVRVKPEKWDKIEYGRDADDKITETETGSFTQFPLQLGWAMTIHKAQGKTLDAVNIDISRGAFAHGQTYVALSRTRCAADIHIASPLRPRDIIFDERVLQFVADFRG